MQYNFVMDKNTELRPLEHVERNSRENFKSNIPPYKQEILGVSNELNSFKLEFKEELHNIKKTIDDIENSQEQLAADYENQKGKINKELMNKQKSL